MYLRSDLFLGMIADSHSKIMGVKMNICAIVNPCFFNSVLLKFTFQDNANPFRDSVFRQFSPLSGFTIGTGGTPGTN